MMTGGQYKDSLKDGRATYFEGRRVDDLPGHPILGVCVENVARGYDRLYRPGAGAVSPLMQIPTSADDLRGHVPLLHEAGLMAHVTYTSIMTLTTAAGRMQDAAAVYLERIGAYVDDVQRRDLRITQCITDAKGDRSHPPK